MCSGKGHWDHRNALPVAADAHTSTRAPDASSFQSTAVAAAALEGTIAAAVGGAGTAAVAVAHGWGRGWWPGPSDSASGA